MKNGTVKWFNNAKGFGFLTCPELSEDVFAHHSQIDMDGYRSLKAGEAVQFTLEQGPNGLSASRIARTMSRNRTPS